MEINLTPIIQAIITLLAALVTYKLVPWIKARTTAEQQAILLTTTRTLVFAAEQIYGPLKGKEKLLYVKGKLAQKGYSVDIDAIEAMVREMNIEAPYDLPEQKPPED